MKTRYDTKATGHQFKESDKVWFYNPTRRKGLSPKLQSHWDGPYTILKIINDAVIRIHNTKVIGQDALQKFKEELGNVMKDPYQVVMRQTTLPITLLNESGKMSGEGRGGVKPSACNFHKTFVCTYAFPFG
ncbi:retrovirus-related Pol polyprotein from transposon 412 [Trichonephila clavipes]|nr:retrovirus-related Pol polyprotein from transposon 412 [Trichonephila clavipes]